MKNKLPQRINPRLKGFDYSKPFAYFTTISAKDKRKIFCNEALNSEIINCLKLEKEKVGVEVLAYCLMPDHFHMLISPSDSGTNISRFIGGFKNKATRIEWRYGIEEKMWQARFHDHILGPNEPVNDVCEYILNNPVTKNLVESWEDYKFCGFLDPVPA
ncbi:MAG: hypothetical protein GTO24_10730 [candidate division Zixibacteria bacterium]|nr:hypothetical protein [candidate division Zixibacteria bacterium]